MTLYIAVIGWVLNFISGAILLYLDIKSGSDIMLSDFVRMMIASGVPFLSAIVVLIVLLNDNKTVLIKGKKR